MKVYQGLSDLQLKIQLFRDIIEKVIFNVFKDEDERFYKQVLQKNL